jgi:hypothetical protein
MIIDIDYRGVKYGGTYVGSHTNWHKYALGLMKPNYPVPANIGRVSLGTDYPGVWFIDDADQDDPVMLWSYDTWTAPIEDDFYWRHLG